jgi:hypothetical protein
MVPIDGVGIVYLVQAVKALHTISKENGDVATLA